MLVQDTKIYLEMVWYKVVIIGVSSENLAEEIVI